jgi:hypothetical protein
MRQNAMIKATRYQSITRFDLARTLAGRGRYWTTAYLVDDLLIDSGCAHTARELADALCASPPTRLVNRSRTFVPKTVF